MCRFRHSIQPQRYSDIEDGLSCSSWLLQVKDTDLALEMDKVKEQNKVKELELDKEIDKEMDKKVDKVMEQVMVQKCSCSWDRDQTCTYSISIFLPSKV